MSQPFAVQEPVAIGLIRHHLSGFRGYPPSDTGEKVFARGLQECTISVEHAEAVLKKFDERFPTLREIIDTGNSLRSQFEPKESQAAKWEREYGKPVPFDTSMEGTCLCCGRPWSEILAHRAVSDEMWRRIKAHLKVSDFSETSWPAVYRAKKELGYPLTFEEERILAKAS
jgi:hypothetical protein